MKIGTKSVLYGAHCFFLHPWFVAYAWYKLYGFPWDPRLWVAFFVHDLGYWGKPNMDGAEGEMHVLFGARIMNRLFGDKWGKFTGNHSRYWAKRFQEEPSKLCFADKMAWIYTPDWLYLPLVIITGECWEYMHRHSQECGQHTDPRKWLKNGKEYTKRWVETHINGDTDTWTVDRKNT